MHIRIERKYFSEHSTIGELLIDGEFFCHTLEPKWTEQDVKPRAIPEGTYSLTNRFSPKHGHSVPHVEKVPGFEEIEIHPGNYPKDTLGCCLVGKSYRPGLPDFIRDSREAFAGLMEQLLPVWDRKEPIDITYVNIKSAAAGVGA